MTVNATHATRARRSHRPCKVVRRGVRALIPGPLIPDPTLLPPLPQHHSTICSTSERYEEKSIKNISLHQLPTRTWGYRGCGGGGCKFPHQIQYQQRIYL